MSYRVGAVGLFGPGGSGLMLRTMISWVPKIPVISRLSSTADSGGGAEATKENLEESTHTARPVRRPGSRFDEDDETEVRTIWEKYRRKHKGSIPPKKTRIRCRRGPDKIVNNACPICSRNIVIKYTDTKLLEQFISPYTGQILEATKTGLCRQQQKNMVTAVEKAWDHGILPYPIPRKMPEEGFRIPPWNKVDVT